VTVQRVPTDVKVLEANNSEKVEFNVSTNETFDVYVTGTDETEVEGGYIIEKEVEDEHEEGSR
jgi:cephalosporin-C deacetylase-like acetyl esterase